MPLRENKKTVNALTEQDEPLSQVQLRALSTYAAEITLKPAEFEGSFQRVLLSYSSDDALDAVV